MHASVNSAPVFDRGQWRRAALSFLALSAAVPVDVLEERDQQGVYRFMRGRHKYYGIGSLVIFFALFSGYGMGHMLATMSTISAWGAVTAGIIWAVFQWCLERQMLISIRADAAWWKKLFGLSWRGLLALLSASTMVYPFFVESNRAEIDVKVGEMARTRLIDNVQSAQLAVGLPALRQDATRVEGAIKQVDVALASEPPDLAAYRQRAKQCWQTFAKTDLAIQRQLRPLLSQKNAAAPDALLDAKIDALNQKLNTAKAPCQNADSLVMTKLLDWKQQKNAEKKVLLNEQKQVQSHIAEAKQKEISLSESQEKKITLAAQSGFAADFAAVADLVRNDANRRFQLIWWLTWFFAIEMVAILVKFTSTTDVDLRFNSMEVAAQEQISAQLQIQQEQIATQRLQASVQAKGEQGVWLEDDGQMAQARLRLEQELETQLHRQLSELDMGLRLNVEALTLHLSQLDAIQQLKNNSMVLNAGSVDPRIENMVQETIAKILDSLAGFQGSTIKV
ncbi:DUF4407 domain-containing protein [Undibacterium baiyunense]|uniref:DUF4407 domain-containing protein n=1 Tax=Undibacterium baiyunense TaxID=2828731 RepID=A0A941I2S8_9BURK|nr:DUF4407 domain-containing protein [Undibacterium baiyunense]MBR7745324.1 DUF4407 domain-containing protein [Undibacterium baiyunense]